MWVPIRISPTDWHHRITHLWCYCGVRMLLERYSSHVAIHCRPLLKILVRDTNMPIKANLSVYPARVVSCMPSWPRSINPEISCTFTVTSWISIKVPHTNTTNIHWEEHAIWEGRTTFVKRVPGIQALEVGTGSLQGTRIVRYEQPGEFNQYSTLIEADSSSSSRYNSVALCNHDSLDLMGFENAEFARVTVVSKCSTWKTFLSSTVIVYYHADPED